jgi:phenylalanyl-tRNA synthetase beta chain
MRISLEWLSEYCDVSGLLPEAIAEALTRSGLEVEHLEQTGCLFSGVVVGQVETIMPHPNTDRLRLVTVNLGSHNQTVVCGASNVRQGTFVAFAQDGATVISKKENKLFQLGRVSIRGVESAGMICSVEELGLTGEYPDTGEGIWILDDHVTLSGLGKNLGKDLKQALALASDTIMEVSPTANRGDLMSVVGVAREISALFNRPLLPFTTEPETEDTGKKETALPDAPPPDIASSAKNGAPVEIRLSSPDVCTYYSAVTLENITISASPAWMVKRLEAAGIRSINNVVDITNYVMLETGNPLHAFDLDKLSALALETSSQASPANTIALDVRYPDPEQEEQKQAASPFITLDNTARSLTGQTVMIMANDRPVAMAGVMGGAETGVEDNTTALLLEVACFPAASTRKSSKSVGIRTEASARFERGVDWTHCDVAMSRAVQLLKRYAGVDVSVSAVVQSSADTPITKAAIPLRLEKLEQILGIAIPEETVIRILEQLGFCVNFPEETCSDKTRRSQDVSANVTGKVLAVTVPEFRALDVQREIDLIEEVIRIYGYDQVPYTLPQKMGASTVSFRATLLETTERIMQAKGLQSVITTSLVGENLLQKAGFSLDEQQTVSVLNSHSVDHTVMRQSLLPNLLEVTQFNLAQGAETIWIYELGRTYHRVGKSSLKHSGVSERLNLSGLIMGDLQKGFWQNMSGKETLQPAVHQYYQLKGILEEVFSGLGLSTTDICFDVPDTTEIPGFLHPGQMASVMLKASKKHLGYLGVLHPVHQQKLKFKRPAVLFELNMEYLLKAIQTQYQPTQLAHVSLYPPVHRDIAFSAPVGLPHQSVCQVFETLNEPLLKGVELFDDYRGQQLETHQKSLAYRLTFQSANATMTDHGVDSVLNTLKAALREELAKQHYAIEFR